MFVRASKTVKSLFAVGFALLLGGLITTGASSALADPAPTLPATNVVHHFGYGDQRAINVDASTGAAVLSNSADAPTGWSASAIAGGYEYSTGWTWILTEGSPCELHAQDAQGGWHSSFAIPGTSTCMALLVNNDVSGGAGTAYISSYDPHAIMKIDLSTGSVLSTVSTGSVDVRSIAKSPTTSKVWALVVGPDTYSGMFELNLATGALTNRIDIESLGIDFWGFAFDDSGRAWMNTFVYDRFDNLSENHLSSLNPEAESPLTTFVQGPRVRLAGDDFDFDNYAIWITSTNPPSYRDPSAASGGQLASTGRDSQAAIFWAAGAVLALLAGAGILILRRRA